MQKIYVMRRIIILLFVVILIHLNSSAQNSSIQNSDFETTSPINIAWSSQTNTGSGLIVNEDNILCIDNNLNAHSGNYFAAIGGVQDASGLYQATLAQQFHTTSGVAHLGFYFKYGRESVDPGSYIRILVDGIEVWSIAPHFVVDASDEYEFVGIQLGHFDAGNHTIELKGYEYPLGGDLPMLFTFDDITLQVTSTASIDEENTEINLICLPGFVQIQTNKAVNQDAKIELIDLSGKVVASTLTHFESSYNLPVQFYNSGIYILNFRSDDLSISKKIFIQN